MKTNSIADTFTFDLSSDLEPWPDPVDGKALLDDLSAVLFRFVVLPKWAPETLALWALHTYAFQLRDITTYIGIESPEKRCGKTTLLAVLTELVNRPVAAANISSPAFFRLIEENHPTLLIDEADTFLQSNERLRGILNAGYSRKTAFVVRVAHPSPNPNLNPLPHRDPNTSTHAHHFGPRTLDSGPRPSRLARFSCWCPKAISAIGHLPDTLADRCIVIRMQRKTSSEQCQRLRELDTLSLRRQCARFVLDHADAIANACPHIPGDLNDRAADIWEPLLALADLAGEHWPDLARLAAVELAASSQQSNPISSLLLDIRVAFLTSRSERIFSHILTQKLNSLSDRPWSHLTRGRPGCRSGGVTEVWLAQQLRPYGIRPTTLRISGLRAKGYEKEDFRQIFGRYIPKSDVQALISESKPASHPESLDDQLSPDPELPPAGS